MGQEVYRKLQDMANEVARTLPIPSFYKTFSDEIRKAEDSLNTHDLVGKCRAYLDESLLECAHGVCHCESVARDAGALILIEAPSRDIGGAERDRLVVAALIAGLLHDIKRREKDHAVLGSIEAGRILSDIGVESRYRSYITEAIKNHEAFRKVYDSDDKAARLVSDALYDADKFRWGPENFTVTLWLIVEARNTPPEALHRTFKDKMKGIEKIKETFRTRTGRQYGPEFIDQGIRIGNAIYEALSALIGRGNVP